MMWNKILVECYNDETLFKAFNISKYDIEHNLDGKTEVLDKIENRNNCLAVIDNDKGTNHRYFNQANLIKILTEDIKVFYESNRNNYFLVFYPRLENVIERLVQNNERNISTAENLGLKTDWKSLHNIGSNEDKLKKLKDLFIALINRSHAIKI